MKRARNLDPADVTRWCILTRRNVPAAMIEIGPGLHTATTADVELHDDHDVAIARYTELRPDWDGENSWPEGKSKDAKDKTKKKLRTEELEHEE